MTVADRWFYFPIVGALGIVGVGLQLLTSVNHLLNKSVFIGTVIILCLFSLRTFIRTFDFKDNLTLYAHDLKNQEDNLMLMDEYITELRTAGNTDEALKYAEKAVSLDKSPYATRITAYDYLALLYQGKNQNDKAIAAYEHAVALSKFISPSDMNDPSFLAIIYDNLASAYLYDYRYKDIVSLVNDQTLKKFPQDPCLYMHLAIAQHYLGHLEEARKASSQAYKLFQIKDTALIPSQSTLNKMCNFTEVPDST